MEQKSLKKYIAVGIAILIFIPIFFGRQLFPALINFNVFQNNPLSDDSGEGAAAAPDHGSADGGTILDTLTDPVTILDIEAGEGAVASESNTVSVGYIGTYLDKDTGKEIIFDQNTNRDAAFSFILGSGQVIPGFDIGVTGMREGGKRLVIIKPEMGYGSQQNGAIPPNTTLQFMIELYEVK